ncbi:MAG: hypothetical protein ACKPKO_21260, partial [Candidatus Fonsibacter sp.]
MMKNKRQQRGVEEWRKGRPKAVPFPLLPRNRMLNTSQFSKAKRAKRGYALVEDSPAQKPVHKGERKDSETPLIGAQAELLLDIYMACPAPIL